MKPSLAVGCLVIALLVVQSWWMGRAAALLDVGLVISYAIWIVGRWRGDAETILPMYLLAIVVQCLHFTEEYLTGFQRQFPALIGYTWSDSHFVIFNMAWIALFVAAALAVYQRQRPAYLFVIFLALVEGIGNGAGHLILSAIEGRYFPGLVTAPLCLLAGIALLTRLFGRNTKLNPKNQ